MSPRVRFSRNLARLASTILACLIAAGCGSVPATHYYVLQLRPDAADVGDARREGGLRVGVRDFAVDPPYDEDRIVYRVAERPSEVGFYAYHRWAAPLPGMLALVASETLSGTAGIGSIEPAAPGRVYDAMLEGRLLTLEEVDHADGQEVAVRVELTLRHDDGREIWSGKCSASDRLETRAVADVVERMGPTVSRAIGSVRDELTRALVRDGVGGER